MGRFGVLALGSTFDEMCEVAQRAEEYDFDGCFFPEHHQQNLWPSAPLVLMAGVAARTRRVRLGTSIIPLSLHHPVAIAEAGATLDNLSGGRFILGVGLGYQPRDFGAYSVRPTRRVSLVEEGVEVIRRSWTEDCFSFHGKRFSLDNVSILPKPLQKPRPPIWFAAWTEPGVRRAARIADAWVTDPIQNLKAVKTLTAAYREEASREGKKARVVLMRHCAIAETKEQAMETHGEAVANIWRYYWLNKSFNADLEPWLKEVKSPEEITVGLAARDRAIFGSPADCIQQTKRWLEETGADYVQVIFTPTLGQDSHQQALEQLRLFGEKVLPYFAEMD